MQSHHQEKQKEEEDALGRGKRRSAAVKVNYRLDDEAAPKKGKSKQAKEDDYEAEEEPSRVRAEEPAPTESSSTKKEEAGNEAEEDTAEARVELPAKSPGGVCPDRGRSGHDRHEERSGHDLQEEHGPDGPG